MKSNRRRRNFKRTNKQRNNSSRAYSNVRLVDWLLDRIDVEKETLKEYEIEQGYWGKETGEDCSKNDKTVSFQGDENLHYVLLYNNPNEDSNGGRRRFDLKRCFFSKRSLALFISILFHLILLGILASIFFSLKVGLLGNLLVSGFSSDVKSMSFIDAIGNTSENTSDFENQNESDELTTVLDNELLESQVFEELNNTKEVLDSTIVGEKSDSISNESLVSSEYGQGIPFYAKKGITSGRKKSSQKYGQKGRSGDVTNESEDAVERGLDWLARHQLPDGSWSFDLKWKDHEEDKVSICNGKECDNSISTSGGSLYLKKLHPSQTAATALALLPFLGAGYTHIEKGKYQKTISMGLRFIEYQSVSCENGIDFRVGFTGDGSAYIQALCTLVCCEGYEMTHDVNLKKYAEGGIRFIENSQLTDGAWRYNLIGDSNFNEKIAGDTSVLGWQMLALKSGISAGFTIRPSVAYRVADYLDSVSVKNGKYYRYQVHSPEKEDKMWGTTAVGVLVREYLGWEPGTGRLDVGINQLVDWIDKADSIWKKVQQGEKKGQTKKQALTYFKEGRLVYNLYFAYYASLALHHYGSNLWTEHFAKIRDMLVATQSKGGALGTGCDKGSWLFYDTYMNDGGRLLNTSLAILILETPYRYLPMYRNDE